MYLNKFKLSKHHKTHPGLHMAKEYILAGITFLSGLNSLADYFICSQ